MKKRLIALLLAVVLCIGLLPVSASAASVDWVDRADTATGGLEKMDLTRNGEYAEDSLDANWTESIYIVQANSNVTITGDLTVGRNTTIILCDNSTLKVTGSLNVAASGACIFGQTSTHQAEDAGKLIVQNTVDAGPAVRNAGGSELSIYGGSMELHGGTGNQITDNVGLYSSGSNGTIMKGTRDGEALTLDKWDGVQALMGSTLVLEYCRHTDNDLLDYKYDGNDKHHLHCDVCGLNYGSESCNFNGGDTINAGAEGHRRSCWCGNQESTITEHTLVSVPTRDGQGHVSGCAYCDYKSGGFGDPHNWIYDENNKNTGECSDCGFSPVAADDYSNLYGSLEDALKAATEGYKIKLYTVKEYAEGEEKVIRGSVVFNAPGETVTLDMNGYTLESSNTVLMVEAGTLTLTGANGISIVQSGRNETAAPAIEVTGGKLIVDGDLTAEGGIVNGNRKPAVEATGGEIEFNGNLKLGGGLTLLKDAKLTKLLSQGFFWSGDGTNQDTLNDRIDLWGGSYANKSKHYTALSDILENGYALAYCDMDGNPTLEDGSYKFYGLFGNEASSVNVTIVEHPQHTWEPLDEDKHYCTACKTRAAHTLENGVCSVCSYACKHEDVNPETLQCARCKMTMVARSEKDSTTTYYSDLRTALETAETGSTITLLADAAPRGADIYGDSTTRKVLTLNLNGHSVTSEAFTISIGEKYIPYPGKNEYYPATLKIIGTGDLKVPIAVTFNSTLDLSEWTGAHIQYVGVNNEGSVLIGPSSAAATIDKLQLSGWGYGKQGTLSLNGGAIGELFNNSFDNDNEPTYPYSSFLLPGYAFKQNGAYLKYTDVLPFREEVYNLSVVPCPHGNLAPDSDGKLRCGYCNADMSGFAVEITDKDGNTGYSSDPHADGFYRAEAVKVKLLKNFDDLGTVNHAMTIDLNGKTITDLRVEAAGVQIIDSAETKGSIGKLTVTADGVTLRDLLADGYGFRSTDGTWVAEGAATASNVSIAEVPIKDVYFFEGEEKEENKITSLTKTYGEAHSLKAHIVWGTNGSGSASQAMYLVKDDGSLKPVDGGSTYALPLFDYAGTYTYRYTVSAEGYSRSADITVTVTPADIARVEVGLTDQGKLMFTPNPTTGEGTQVTAQVSSVSFKNRTQDASEYTVSGNTGINVGDYELTIKAASNSQKFTGSKTVSWKITPFTLGAPNFTGGPLEKNYDGTTTPPTGYFAGSFDSNGSSSITLTEGTHLTSTANLVDANVGNGKAINFSVTLKSPNYVFSSRLNAVENCTVSADGKTLTYSNYSNFGSSLNVKPIDLPVALPALSTDITNGAVQTYTMPLSLPALPAPMQYGTVTYGTPAFTAEPLSSGESYDITATVDENGVLSLEVRGTSGSKVGKIGTVTIPVTTTNFNQFELTVDVNAQPAPHTGYSDQVKKQSEEYEAKKRGELPETVTFTDVDENDYFFDAVEWAAENGITGGVSAERFGAALDCSRAQTMTFLWRAMGEPEPGSYDPALTDVKRGSYYYDAVLWAMQEGITTGAGKGLFAPDKAVTRGQFVTFLYRLSGEKSDAVHPFTDVPAGSYYGPAIAWAYSKGITTGTSKTAFSPDAPCTRAQIITFLYRYFNQK